MVFVFPLSLLFAVVLFRFRAGRHLPLNRCPSLRLGRSRLVRGVHEPASSRAVRMLSPEPKQRAGHTPEATQVTTQVTLRELPEGLFFSPRNVEIRGIRSRIRRSSSHHVTPFTQFCVIIQVSKHYAGVDHQMKKTRVVRMLFVYFSI